MTYICYTQQSNARYPMFYSLSSDVDVDVDVDANAGAATLIDESLYRLK
ncbi:MAG: hypothetical protein KBT63_07695 [Porticoccaceae bacterium]|nr:hypothetical protein [Porticoccaceae bacterium]